MSLIHQPPCSRWEVHSGKLMDEDPGWIWRLESFTQVVIETWADEQLMGDPTFYEVLDELGADTRADLDRARRITEPI